MCVVGAGVCDLYDRGCEGNALCAGGSEGCKACIVDAGG